MYGRPAVLWRRRMRPTLTRQRSGGKERAGSRRRREASTGAWPGPADDAGYPRITRKGTMFPGRAYAGGHERWRADANSGMPRQRLRQDVGPVVGTAGGSSSRGYGRDAPF